MWVISNDAECIVSYLQYIEKDFNYIIHKLITKLNIDFNTAYEYYLKYNKK